MSTYPGERCQHMKMSGDRCGASALRDLPPAPFLLPVLEDAASIQLAITQVCEHLLHRRLDAKKAGILLYAMQVASSNLGRLNEDKSQDKNQKKSAENNQGNSVEASSPMPPSSEAVSGQDGSGSISSGEPDRLPPGTIQACEQPRRFVV